MLTVAKDELTLYQASVILGVSKKDVLKAIHDGDLEATNLSVTKNARSRWLISQEALKDYLRRLAAQPQHIQISMGDGRPAEFLNEAFPTIDHLQARGKDNLPCDPVDMVCKGCRNKFGYSHLARGAKEVCDECAVERNEAVREAWAKELGEELPRQLTQSDLAEMYQYRAEALSRLDRCFRLDR